MVGSYYYVASLPDEELERIVAVYNMDMVGTSWGDESILIAWTVDGQRNIVTDTAIAAGARLTVLYFQPELQEATIIPSI